MLRFIKQLQNCASKILAEACSKVDLIIYTLKGKGKCLTYSNNIFLSIAVLKADQLKEVVTIEQSMFSQELQVKYII